MVFNDAEQSHVGTPTPTGPEALLQHSLGPSIPAVDRLYVYQISASASLQPCLSLDVCSADPDLDL